jgi:hypothetical protein
MALEVRRLRSTADGAMLPERWTQQHAVSPHRQTVKLSLRSFRILMQQGFAVLGGLQGFETAHLLPHGWHNARESV